MPSLYIAAALNIKAAVSYALIRNDDHTLKITAA